MPIVYKAGMHVGSVGSNGTAIKLPSGWSSSLGTSGLYTLTHNLGHTDYIFVVTAKQFNAQPSIAYYDKANNSIKIQLRDTVDSNHDNDWDFILVVY